MPDSVMFHRITDFRLIREKSGKPSAKQRTITGIMGLIHRIYKKAHRRPVQGINIPGTHFSLTGNLQYCHYPIAFRHIPIQYSLLHKGAQIPYMTQLFSLLRFIQPCLCPILFLPLPRFTHIRLCILRVLFPLCSAQPCRHCRQPLPFLQVNDKPSMLHRASHINMIIIQKQLPIRRILPHLAVGISAGKMCIVQHPYTHVQFSGGFQDNIHIPPPSFSHKVRVRS